MNVYFIEVSKEKPFNVKEVVSKECGIPMEVLEEMTHYRAIALLPNEKFIEYSTDNMTLKEYTDYFNLGAAPCQDNSYIRFI